VAPLALALHLALASSGLTSVPDLQPRPLAGQTLALASAGALAGDALVIGAGYLTLQLFAADAISPTADNFRSAAYAMLAAAVLVPPLTAVLLGRLGHGGRDATIWRALALAAVGQVATLAVGWAAAPHFWVMLPVQVAALSVGTSLGLHWGRRARTPAPARAAASHGGAVDGAPRGDASPPDRGAIDGAPGGDGRGAAVLVPVCPVG
jgi:hypothetical protein